jgi:hypothetical protein
VLDKSQAVSTSLGVNDVLCKLHSLVFCVGKKGSGIAVIYENAYRTTDTIFDD